MQINVAQQLKSTIGSVRDYELSAYVDIAGGPRPVEGSVRFTRVDRGILVQGSLRTAREIECSRCLCLYLCPLVLDIEEEYFPTTDVISGHRLELPDKPGCFAIDEHHILDITEAVRQYSLLAIPMKPVCRQDCVGLCPQCGRNLNLESCTCNSGEADPRWSVLLKLEEESKGTR